MFPMYMDLFCHHTLSDLVQQENVTYIYLLHAFVFAVVMYVHLEDIKKYHIS